VDIEYDRDVDAVAVEFSDARSASTRRVDDLRLADYGEDGQLVGLEFFRASRGVRLGGLPLMENGINPADLARELIGADVQVLDIVTALTQGVDIGSSNVAAPDLTSVDVRVFASEPQVHLMDSAGFVNAG
jgi:uncharacterized protein YuzE